MPNVPNHDGSASARGNVPQPRISPPASEGSLSLEGALPCLESFLAERLSGEDKPSLLEALELIHTAAHGDEASHEPVLGRERSGAIVIIEGADPALLSSGTVVPLTPHSEVLRQFGPYLDRIVTIFDSYYQDYDDHEDSVSWLAAHNLWHLRDHGAREVLWQRLGLNVDNID